MSIWKSLMVVELIQTKCIPGKVYIRQLIGHLHQLRPSNLNLIFLCGSLSLSSSSSSSFTTIGEILKGFICSGQFRAHLLAWIVIAVIITIIATLGEIWKINLPDQFSLVCIAIFIKLHGRSTSILYQSTFLLPSYQISCLLSSFSAQHCQTSQVLDVCQWIAYHHWTKWTNQWICNLDGNKLKWINHMPFSTSAIDALIGYLLWFLFLFFLSLSLSSFFGWDQLVGAIWSR